MEGSGRAGRVGIIGALEEEVGAFAPRLSHCSTQRCAGIDIRTGTLSGVEVALAKCGVGKVNAALAAQLLISRFHATSIIFTGVAGALGGRLAAGGVIVSSGCIQHDMDASALGFERGRIPYTELMLFESNVDLADLALASAKKAGLDARQGRVLSGDKFISDPSENAMLRKRFGGDCVDMESAAVAQVCTLNQIPHVIIRSISDHADGSAQADFRAFCAMAAKNSFEIVEGMLKGMRSLPPAEEGAGAIRDKIRTVPDWPKKGIMFRDITTLLKDEEAFGEVITILARRYAGMGIDLVAGIESRGFIIGAALAAGLRKGFVPIRKAGKLPAKTVSIEYDLEYGKDRIEIHEDAISGGGRVLLVDDLIATGGTALSACRLIEKLGGNVVECAFVIGLPGLGGLERLKREGFKEHHLIEFAGE